MNYIKLGRKIDDCARECGYNEMPDDVLTLILDYTGKIKKKPTNYFECWLKVDYLYRPIKWLKINGKFQYVKTTEIKKGTEYKYCYFCGRCNRLYKNKNENHSDGKLHKKFNKEVKFDRKSFITKMLKFINKDKVNPYFNPRDLKMLDMGLM